MYFYISLLHNCSGLKKQNKTKQRNIHREISRLNGNIAYLQHCVSFRGTAK